MLKPAYLSMAIFVCMMGHDFQEMKRPYFCSTCFTTTQEQNYHCCFHFFKCCAEARLGSRSTTPNPRYPGLPSGMTTFLVQNRNARPCSVDCQDAKMAPNLCCRIQGSKNARPFESGDAVFKPAFDIEEMELESTHQSSDTETSAESASKTNYQNLGLDITGSPFRLNLKNIHSERKLFHTPSLIFDHETEGEERKQGWYTKDILNQEIKNQERRLSNSPT